MIFFQMIEFLATFVECMIGVMFCSAVLKQEKIIWKGSAAGAGITTLVAWTVNQYQLFSMLTTVIGIVGIAITACMIYKLKWVDTFIFATLYLLLIHVIDFLSISSLSILFHDTTFGKKVIESYSNVRLYHILLSKGILLGIYALIVHRFFGNIRTSVRKITAGAILCTTAVYYLGKMTFKQSGAQDLILWLLLLVILLSVLYSSIQYIEEMNSRSCRELAGERNNLIAESYELLAQDYRNYQIYYHNIKNHMIVIKNYLFNHEFDKANAYMDELRLSEIREAPQKWTGIETLDILLDYKVREAQRKRIYIDIQADQLDLKLSEQEITALFGNALNNAIEGCEKLPEGRRWIRVVMRRKNEMSFINISNTFEGQPVVKNEQLFSSKTDKKAHGWGLESMMLIVQKYDGTLMVDYDDQEFNVCISFYN